MTIELEFRRCCDELVEALVGDKMVDAWWKSPNKAFEMRTPEEHFAISSDDVVNYLMACAFTGGGS